MAAPTPIFRWPRRASGSSQICATPACCWPSAQPSRPSASTSAARRRWRFWRPSSGSSACWMRRRRCWQPDVRSPGGLSTCARATSTGSKTWPGTGASRASASTACPSRSGTATSAARSSWPTRRSYRSTQAPTRRRARAIVATPISGPIPMSWTPGQPPRSARRSPRACSRIPSCTRSCSRCRCGRRRTITSASGRSTRSSNRTIISAPFPGRR